MNIKAHIASQHDEIWRRLKMAVVADGNSFEPVDLFHLIEDAWCGLLLADPRQLEVLGVAYPRAFHPDDADHWYRQTQTCLKITAMNPALKELAELLEEYLDRFLSLRNRNPEVANQFARAVFLLSPKTVEMDIN